MKRASFVHEFFPVRTQVRELVREEVESNLTFAGFVVISCPLKPDSLKVIQMLKSSSHHVTMVTGDNPLTACHVSDLLGITRPDTPTLVFTPPNELGMFRNISRV